MSSWVDAREKKHTKTCKLTVFGKEPWIRWFDPQTSLNHHLAEDQIKETCYRTVSSWKLIKILSTPSDPELTFKALHRKLK